MLLWRNVTRPLSRVAWQSCDQQQCCTTTHPTATPPIQLVLDRDALLAWPSPCVPFFLLVKFLCHCFRLCRRHNLECGSAEFCRSPRRLRHNQLFVHGSNKTSENLVRLMIWNESRASFPGSINIDASPSDSILFQAWTKFFLSLHQLRPLLHITFHRCRVQCCN